MIIQLSPEDIAKHWELIKYGTLQVATGFNPAAYSTNLLKNLLLGKCQCWFSMDQGRKIKMLVITRINNDEGDTKHLFIGPVYGFSRSYDNEWKEALNSLVKFSEGMGLNSLIVATMNPRVVQLCNLLNFKKTYDVYEYNLKGDKK